jgi:hypothetical protein
MARQIEEFILAWNALSGVSQKEGWLSIAVAPAGPCILEVGRHFPGNRESLLVGFPNANLLPTERLPEGKGFKISRADPYGDGKTWIALTRKESGSAELFSNMVYDVAQSLDSSSGDSEERLLRGFLSRVRSWQEFMQKGGQALSVEEEVGLLGELTFLAMALHAKVPTLAVVESWVGPFGGIQDFELGAGAVEVKATLADQGFTAKISSLEQLSDAVRKPLFLAGIRFKQSDSGKSLPEVVGELNSYLLDDAEALKKFSDRILAAGFHDLQSEVYTRRLSFDEIKTFLVDEGFPRLTPMSVHACIQRASYEIDLDRVTSKKFELSEMLQILGLL